MEFRLYHDLSRTPGVHRMAIGDASPPPDIEASTRALMASGVAITPEDYPMRFYAVDTVRAPASARGNQSFVETLWGQYTISILSHPDAGDVDDGSGGAVINFVSLDDGNPPFADVRIRAGDHLQGPIIADLVGDIGNPVEAPDRVRLTIRLVAPEFDYRAAMFTDVLGMTTVADIVKQFHPAPGPDANFFFAVVKYFGKFEQGPAYVGPPVPIPKEIVDQGVDVTYNVGAYVPDEDFDQQTFTVVPNSDNFRGLSGPGDGSTDIWLADSYTEHGRGHFRWEHPDPTPPSLPSPYPNPLLSDTVDLIGLQADIAVEAADVTPTFQPAPNEFGLEGELEVSFQTITAPGFAPVANGSTTPIGAIAQTNINGPNTLHEDDLQIRVKNGLTAIVNLNLQPTVLTPTAGLVGARLTAVSPQNPAPTVDFASPLTPNVQTDRYVALETAGPLIVAFTLDVTIVSDDTDRTPFSFTLTGTLIP